jgi:DNA-binding YbaB/EbfC family protein
MNINPFDILKNAQALQGQMGALQEKLANLKVSGSSGGGMVSVELNGKMEALDVRIDPITLTDKEMLEDLVQAAINDAMEKTRAAISREAAQLAQQAGIQGLAQLAGMPGMPGFTGPA